MTPLPVPVPPGFILGFSRPLHPNWSYVGLGLSQWFTAQIWTYLDRNRAT